MARLESFVRSPAADGTVWTVVRPPMPTDGPLTRAYRTAENAPLVRPKSLSRADLAHYLLTHVDDRRAHRAVVEVAYREPRTSNRTAGPPARPRARTHPHPRSRPRDSAHSYVQLLARPCVRYGRMVR
ncbi:NAD(P)H-binding protein [Streptomyces sp. NPDC006197]|uniref:NAD(P)H-binding protein n=1 Tax=Streptomyces sp. NPDC006197 TaxID=3156685 RepID=UPI0033B6F54A